MATSRWDRFTHAATRRVRRAWRTQGHPRWLIVGERARQYARLTRLDRPIGIYLLLWPTLWALWIAGEGRPDPWVLLVFAAGVVLMRSAGCAINDFADRKFDRHVARTRERPMATGAVSVREALTVFGVLVLAAFALVLTLNWLTVALSFGALALAAIYPFMKRYTHLPQVVLGMAFAWAVPMAFAAQTGAVAQEAWLLYLATVAWTVAYDTQYAMADRADDARIGVKSTALLFGEADRHVIGALHAFTLVTLVIVGLRLELGAYYYAGLGVAGVLAVYQQFLIHARAPQACVAAFLNNHWFGMAVFCGIVFAFLRP